jgi:hypothetical protein
MADWPGNGFVEPTVPIGRLREGRFRVVVGSILAKIWQR